MVSLIDGKIPQIMAPGVADFSGKAVLVTGGTKGIGLATALAFAERGAICWLTYLWGSADESDVRREFAARGACEPHLVQADVSSSEDLEALLQEIRSHHDRLEVFISNVASAQTPNGLADYSERGLLKSIEYSAWPLVSHTLAVRRLLGHYPQYVLGVSSLGIESRIPGYDFAAASKSVLEALCRYLAYRLKDEDVRVNVIRAGLVKTESAAATLGDDAIRFVEEVVGPDGFVAPEDVANVAVALCSGLMDAVNGQILTVDRGQAFRDNMFRLFDRSVGQAPAPD